MLPGHWFPLEYDMDSALAGSPCQGELLVSLKIFVGDKEADMENDDGMIELSSSKRLLVHVDRVSMKERMDFFLSLVFTSSFFRCFLLPCIFVAPV